ncbi:hypothetical protein C7S16_1004 [Burkholderia thailandensis]|uniref:Uncharacterized protein n=1 Tax=Burkholderia thailandensis TaxID=57975 RepID=A0AAW9D0I1_BURTH|nr:hypothetical protein [Burkholderia thailandensis]MDW9256334.1 hypothetical protein [Burkholderia thailandensis]
MALPRRRRAAAGHAALRRMTRSGAAAQKNGDARKGASPF